jgi:hypothetical protein
MTNPLICLLSLLSISIGKGIYRSRHNRSKKEPPRGSTNSENGAIRDDRDTGNENSTSGKNESGKNKSGKEPGSSPKLV